MFIPPNHSAFSGANCELGPLNSSPNGVVWTMNQTSPRFLHGGVEGITGVGKPLTMEDSLGKSVKGGG